MSETKTQELKLSDLMEGDLVWSVTYKRVLQFQELIDEYGYLFKNVGQEGYTILFKDNIEPLSSLMKELY